MTCRFVSLLLNHYIYEFPGHIDHIDDCFALQERLYFLAGQRHFLRLFFGDRSRHGRAVAQFAVNLQYQRDLVLFGQRLIPLRPLLVVHTISMSDSMP